MPSNEPSPATRRGPETVLRSYEDLIQEAREHGEPPEMTRPELAGASLVIAREYHRQGLTMTLRQLYYQLVARGLLANGKKHYKRVGATLTKARLSGAWPVSLLEDRTRTVGITDAASEQIDIQEALDLAAEQIKMMPAWNLVRAAWFDQPVVLSVWVEKEALAGVFERICRQLGIGLFPCKGYPSVTTLWKWLEGADEATQDDPDRECVVLYFGDHDPDGLEIPRGVERSLNELLASGVIKGRCPEGQDWNAKESYADPLRFRFERLGLSLEQINEFNPPPVPGQGDLGQVCRLRQGDRPRCRLGAGRPRARGTPSARPGGSGSVLGSRDRTLKRANPSGSPRQHAAADA